MNARPTKERLPNRFGYWLAGLPWGLLLVAAASPVASEEPRWNDPWEGQITSLRQKIGVLKGEPDWPALPDRPVAHRDGCVVADSEGAGPDSLVPRAMALLSMALAVGSLGVLIGTRPERGPVLGRINRTREARRRVLQCGGLLVVLSLFDLACTLLALPTEGFLEANPIAAQFAQTVPELVATKTALTAACAAALLAFWHYRVAQVGCWWACAAYTVVAIRWATYHSMFLG